MNGTCIDEIPRLTLDEIRCQYLGVRSRKLSQICRAVVASSLSDDDLISLLIGIPFSRFRLKIKKVDEDHVA